TGSGTITIGAGDEPSSNDPSILASVDRIVGESDGFIDVPVTLSAPSPNPVSVHFAANDSSAASGVVCNNNQLDYVTVTGTLTFAPGETTKVVRVQILDCDGVEVFQAFTLDLG